MTAVCACSLHSHQVCTYSQSLVSSNTHVIRPPLFVCLLDLPARLTRNPYYTAGFSDGHYPTSQQLTLIRKKKTV